MTATAIAGSLAVAIADGGRLEPIRQLVPDPAPGEARITVDACGLCGSDLHLLAAGRLGRGTILGHEAVGTVEAVGEGAPPHALGRRVVVRPRQPCEDCAACRGGDPHLCTPSIDRAIGMGHAPGAFAEQLVVPFTSLVPISDDLGDHAATLVEPLAVALRGIAAAEQVLAGGHDEGVVAVVGGGPIGLLTALALEALDHEDVHLVEPGHGRAAHARRRGLRVGHPGCGSARLVFQCAGGAEATADALDLARTGATLVFLGASHEPVELSQTRLVVKELTMRGAFGCRAIDFDRALGLLEQGTVRAADVITNEIALADLPAAIADATLPHTTWVKAVVRPRQPPAKRLEESPNAHDPQSQPPACPT
jgi:threonine dehydrogenase-like Zn-dependent dehydrogenase